MIRSKLAEGGMGAVYVAEHERLQNTRKIVKILLPEYSRNEVIRHRFEREATAVSRLKHKHIITIDDFGTLDDGQLFLMMPFLDGQSLDEYLRHHGKFTQHRTLHIGLQVCSALHHAHQAGFVHRDLKPGNIFITPADDNPYRVTLIDLGIARDLAAEGPGGSGPSGPQTHTGISMGTPGYMAVEQYGNAGNATPLADLYAMAIVMWEMLTGRPPWGVHDERVLYFKQMTERPERPPEHEISTAWASILLAALAVQPSDRPQSMRAFAVALASATPAIPPHVPSGADMLASLAKEFIERAALTDETVRNQSHHDRVAPMMWPPRETHAVGLPSTPPAQYAAPIVPRTASGPTKQPGANAIESG
ncbi:MAG: serine/threonine protein kinase, partial [Deltaproteobacteria bacterium]|nr:serine/threonine protein kinase [Deltaproteobacteria bacterium]